MSGSNFNIGKGPGSIMNEFTIDPDRVVDFLAALMAQLAGPQTRAVFWFYDPVQLPVAANPVKGTSPFAQSGAVLAGDGYLVDLIAAQAELLMSFFANDMHALSALMHVEVEQAGVLQFKSYDNFSINLPGPALDPDWLSALEKRGIVKR